VELVDDGRFDPAGLLATVWAEAAAHGATAQAARVERIEVVGDRHVRVITDQGIVDAQQVVVAAGVWTPELCAPFGPRLPIRPARGNSVTLPDGPSLRLPLLLTDQRLAVNPLAGGLRITGRFELTAPSHRAISERRTKELVRRAAQVLDLPADTAPQHQWTGLRPATPDGLPVIGRMPGAPAVLVAAGHGMLGSTAGPGTGEAVAALLTGDTPLVDDAVVGPARFAHSRRNG
jgi:D-amino-acid dehydrogenase